MLLEWHYNPPAIFQQFASKHNCQEAGALLNYAVWTVESIPYLRGIDARDDLSQGTIDGHAPHVVDVAHVRWAVGSGATALDLCAGALGRAFCGHSGKRELDVAAFDAAGKNKETPALRLALPAPALAWIDALLADSEYDELRTLRNHLTHARVARHFSMPRKRLVLSGRAVPEWLEVAERCSFKHVKALLMIARTL